MSINTVSGSYALATRVCIRNPDPVFRVAYHRTEMDPESRPGFRVVYHSTGMEPASRPGFRVVYSSTGMETASRPGYPGRMAWIRSNLNQQPGDSRTLNPA